MGVYRRMSVGRPPLTFVEGSDPLTVGQADDGGVRAVGKRVPVDDDVAPIGAGRVWGLGSPGSPPFWGAAGAIESAAAKAAPWVRKSLRSQGLL